LSEEDGFEMIYAKFHVIVFGGKTTRRKFYHNSFQRARVWLSEEDDFEMIYGKFQVIVFGGKTTRRKFYHNSFQ
jgi:hypothetical protein